MTITIENDNVNEALEQFFAGLRPRLQRNDVDDSIELTPFTAVIMIMDDDGTLYVNYSILILVLTS